MRQKTLNLILGVAVIAGVGYLIYQKFFKGKQEEKKAETAFPTPATPMFVIIPPSETPRLPTKETESRLAAAIQQPSSKPGATVPYTLVIPPRAIAGKQYGMVPVGGTWQIVQVPKKRYGRYVIGEAIVQE